MTASLTAFMGPCYCLNWKLANHPALIKVGRSGWVWVRTLAGELDWSSFLFRKPCMLAIYTRSLKDRNNVQAFMPLYIQLFAYNGFIGCTNCVILLKKTLSWHQMNQSLQVAVANPLDGCGALKTKYNPYAVLVALPPDSGCPGMDAFFESAEEAGVAAILFADPRGRAYLNEVLYYPLGETYGLSIFLITQAQGLDLVSILQDPSYGNFYVTTTKANAGIDSLAEYSSYGPTIDGRFKPDLIAPGHMLRTARPPDEKRRNRVLFQGSAVSLKALVRPKSLSCLIGHMV
ncbi:hypothetical protein VOLCADRAFT_95170 [Volvox carteri f. nagariensis]|uniref:Uncharacterized protein n=1 Tax=Volvox carteri f. nagariensis TaxID=3068 RepID=D8U6S9_VOLCA|nr:uncharacterized protein VOLCADRAFT_95170 [Volvox carteri f. nagariensis]EFJ44564.1 hypothetical protein VOLCADRAFT_95170 [Volvox carteri f. nagariensis]|eukprot:XP_002954414.1 hypothetical protein VOLCADRAFT_95170 [Volvox carteri f. nagariensis]